jgi:hypothetical protein
MTALISTAFESAANVLHLPPGERPQGVAFVQAEKGINGVIGVQDPCRNVTSNHHDLRRHQQKPHRQPRGERSDHEHRATSQLTARAISVIEESQPWALPFSLLRGRAENATIGQAAACAP